MKPAASCPITHICIIIAGLTGLAGCQGLQSALQPASANAREVTWLWWGMLSGGTLVFLLVLGLLLYTLFSNYERRSKLPERRFIIAGGVVLPVVVLSILLAASLGVGSSFFAAEKHQGLTVHVKGQQWWWEIEYTDSDGNSLFTTANEIYLPVGEQVEFVLTSADVIHSFWVPSLSGKLDLIPGHENHLLIEADRPGIYRGQCAEYCGMAHAKMAFYVVAVSPDKFDAWIRRQQEPAKTPQTASAQQGATRFSEAGCLFCHSVRGHGAWGEAGPDLTHVGSRLTIGAGLMKNNQANLATWLTRNHLLKPGNKMPEYSYLDPQALQDISAYLQSLE